VIFRNREKKKQIKINQSADINENYKKELSAQTAFLAGTLRSACWVCSQITVAASRSFGSVAACIPAVFPLLSSLSIFSI